MTIPNSENAEELLVRLQTLVDKVAEQTGALRKTIFELQTVDWRTQDKLPEQQFIAQIKLLKRINAMNFGYYPDDFYHNHPSLIMLKSIMSLQTFPYGH